MTNDTSSQRELRQEAEAEYQAGAYKRAHAVAVRGIEEHPDDAGLLQIAARSAVALGTDDAASLLRRLVLHSPFDVDAWRDLGAVSMEEGDLAEASRAYRRAITLRQDDVNLLIDLGHVTYAQGEIREAISLLAQSLGRQPGNLAALRGLCEMHRSSGDLKSAVYVATQILQWQPDDLRALIDVADLNLALGNADEAAVAYARLRSVDPESGHEVYAYRGMIRAEIHRERWRRALELAIDSTRIDRFDLTTQALAYIVSKVFGSSERQVPTSDELEAAFSAEAAEHRRLHLDTAAT